MKQRKSDQLEKKAIQKWQYYTQDILKHYSVKRKQLLQDFWADYDQLLAQARQHQLEEKQVKSATQTTPQTQSPTVATTTEYAYLPWVKLMVPYWDELPLTVSYQWLREPSIIHRMMLGVGTILLGILGVIALIALIMLFTLGIHWQLVAAELGAWFIAIGLLNVPLPEIPADKHIFQFQADFLLYEKRTIYFEQTKPNKSIFVKIPYETIGYINTAERGISIYPVIKQKWLNNRNKTCRRLIFDESLVAFNQIVSFIRDVINANYANKNRKP